MAEEHRRLTDLARPGPEYVVHHGADGSGGVGVYEPRVIELRESL